VTNHVNIALVQPLGVREEVFPWGIHLIADHLEHTVSDITVARIFLQRDRELRNLFASYSSLGNTLFGLLTSDAQLPLGGLGGDGTCCLMEVYGSWLGSKLVNWLREQDSYTPGGFERAVLLSEALGTLNSRFLPLLDATFTRSFSGGLDGHTIFGVSVYDGTIFFCLYLADWIRRHFPSVTIIFGGDYFTFENARLLIRDSFLIDGVVVGYGEGPMAQLVEHIRQGTNIGSIHVEGFVNADSLRRFQAPAPIFPERSSKKAVTDTDEAYEIINSHGITERHISNGTRYVRWDEITSTEQLKTLRVLFQRGCSYGRCSFCTQVYKRIYFRLNHQQILTELAVMLSRTKNDIPIIVSFDADEHAPKATLEILEFFSSGAISDEPQLILKLWFQTKYMTPRIARAMTNLRKKSNIQLMAIMNIESLNPVTLSLMNKGHSPLKAIYGAKAVQDSGQFLQTNYMEFFPGENEDNVAQEYELLHRSLHLIAGKVSLFPYAINGRDDLYQNQERFGIRVRGHAKDVWVREFFGHNMPSSIWNFGMDLVACDEATIAWYSYLRDRSADTKTRFQETASRNGARGYLRRAEDFAWLQRVQLRSIFMSSPVSLAIVEDAGGRATIVKDYSAVAGSAREVRQLSYSELELLRFLYVVRSWTEVIERFRGKVSEESLMALKNAHRDFGSIAECEGDLLCTANDPAWAVSQ